MNIHRLFQSVKVKQVFAGAPTNATQAGTTIDTLGFRRLAIVAHVKTGTATSVQLGLQESPDDNSDYVAVTYGNSVSGVAGATVLQPTVAQVASTEAVYLMDIDLSGSRQRYQQITVIGTGTAGDIEVFALLYEAAVAAVTQDKTVCTV